MLQGQTYCLHEVLNEDIFRQVNVSNCAAKGMSFHVWGFDLRQEYWMSKPDVSLHPWAEVPAPLIFIWITGFAALS